MPDIYYIIPDSYASSELLKNSFDYDNGPFEEELKKRGFFTVPDAKSNYVHTYLSLTSSLNGLHLDTLTDIIGADYSDISALHAYISDNKVMRFLKSLGYNIVNLSSGWGPTASLSIADKNINYFEAFDEFTFALAYTTMYKIFHKYHPIRHKTRRTLYYLENSEIFEGPKFLMAHIDSPHPPNTFGPKGEWVKDTEPFYKGFLNKKRYLDEITFFNGKFLRIIDSIRAKSKTEPVIIIQADHGPMFLSVIWRDEKQKFTDEAMVERSSILNTILLPSKCREHLYDTLTPVNTFRIMTNCLFRTNFKMLPDDTYWSIFKKPFKLKKINHILAKRAPQR